MRIKKKQIIEADMGNTSSTTAPQNSNQQTQVTNPDEIKKATSDIEDFNEKVKDSEISAFITKVSENASDDVDDFSADYIDYKADREEQNRQDYDEWLQSPEGQEYINSLESLQESINLKNRKVIKTIKVKDLK